MISTTLGFAIYGGYLYYKFKKNGGFKHESVA